MGGFGGSLVKAVMGEMLLGWFGRVLLRAEYKMGSKYGHMDGAFEVQTRQTVLQSKIGL